MNKRTKIGIIGYGWIAEKMAITLQGMEKVEAYAIASRSITKAKDFADKTVENPYSVKKTAESVFVVTDSISEEENGYVTRQYITVKNQSLYVVTFIVPGIAINQNKSERIDKIINALSFGESNAPKQVSAVSVIVVAALVIIIVLIAVYIAVTVIRDLRKVKNFENQAEE